MSLSNNKNSITSIKWRDFASNLSSKMKRMQGKKEVKEEKKKRSFNFREFNQFLKKFSLRFLRRVYTRKLETR